MIDKATGRVALTNFGQVFSRAIKGTREDLVALPRYAKFPKLQEELGEFAEACLHADSLVVKEDVGTPIEEGADAMLMILDILSDQYPDVAPHQLVVMLEFQLMKKLLKWESYMVKDFK